VDKTGTSYATPHVTGVIALMFQKNPGLDHVDIALALNSTARDPGDGSILPNNDWGVGKVDATAAVNAAPAPAPVAPGGGGGGGGAGGGPVSFWMPPTGIELNEHTLFEKLTHLQEWVLGFPAGHLYAALVSRHFDEVLRLINTNRKVATVWHRNGGPALVRAALAIVEERHAAAIPDSANGAPLAPQLAGILASWRKYASPSLVADIDRYRADILALPGRPLHAVLDAQESAA
jgi:hypothetical protein